VTFDAVVCAWEGTAVGDRGAGAGALGQRVEALCAAGVHLFIVSRGPVEEVDGALRARPTGRGALYLCVDGGEKIYRVTEHGPVSIPHPPPGAEAAAQAAQAARGGDHGGQPGDPTDRPSARGRGSLDADPVDRPDPVGLAARWLARRGVTGQLILVAGAGLGRSGGFAGDGASVRVPELARAVVVSVSEEPETTAESVVHLGGGPGAFLALLDGELARRAARRVPSVDADPRWVVELPVNVLGEQVLESLGALGNGWAATRGSREETVPARSPLFAVSGAYADDGRLGRGPIWTDLALVGGLRRDGERRLVDLRTGVLVRRDAASGFASLRFVSAADPHAMALRAEGRQGDLRGGRPVRDPRDGARARMLSDGVWLGRARLTDDEIAVAAADHRSTDEGRSTVERLAGWWVDRAGAAGDQAVRQLAEARAIGFDGLLADHRAAWAQRWRDAEVVIEGTADAEADELAARFAVFHLLSAAPDSGEAAVGARGLTGEAYGGHVFWDADVFVLPALAAVRPRAARAMLEYRVRRLPAARAAARAQHRSGARFPWESAGDGSDVTPRLVRGAHGEVIRIATGTHEEHIVADVAWSAVQYTAWSGDEGFCVREGGRDLVVEAARYWASRIRRDAGSRGHLYGVMGPDEYHEVVDDNAYTNVMARWNLVRGAELLEGGGQVEDAQEATRWRELAGSLVDGWNADRGLYEQFAGYFDLDPLVVAQFARAPVAIDMLLGPRRVARSQLIKQADVLMLHHLVPDEVVAGSLAACLDFYEPRTAHGSSLSPAISASLLARDGRPEDALEHFRMAARLDLDDLTGTTAGGLHLATMGGVWQALAYGFLGLRAVPFGLSVDPCLPQAWAALSLRLRFRGRRVKVRATHEQVAIACDGPISVSIGGQAFRQCNPPGRTFPIHQERACERSEQ